MLAAEAHRTGVMDRDIFDLIVTVTILSMFLAPYMAAYASPLSERILKKIGGRKRSAASAKAIAETPVSFPRIFIIGFGPAGQRVAEVLMENNFTVAVVELSPKTAAIARQKGLVVHMVDATNSDAIVHIGIRDASLVVVTVPDPHATREIINNIRLLSPKSTIFARSRYHIAIEAFKKSGAAVVIDEETTVGDQLARAIMESSGGEGREALAGALTGEQP